MKNFICRTILPRSSLLLCKHESNNKLTIYPYMCWSKPREVFNSNICAEIQDIWLSQFENNLAARVLIKKNYFKLTFLKGISLLK